VSLLNRDFDSFRRDLQRFSDAHHSGVALDRSTASPFMAMLEHAAYIGDNLSFHIDQCFNELRFETATQLDNVVSFAKSLGYKVRGKGAARGRQAWYIEVPAAVDSSGSVSPDPLYCPVIEKGARSVGPGNVSFETLEDIDFADTSARDVTGSQFSSNGMPSKFVVRRFVDIVQGETKSTTFTLEEFRKFRTVEIPDEDVTEIISVTDSEGNEWYEVDYLAQDWVFDSVTNDASDSSDVPYVLKVVAAPRRFTTNWDSSTRKTSLQFGSGDGVDYDDVLVPNAAEYALPLYGRRSMPGTAIDPQNVLNTSGLGLSPYNTTLTVLYRVGGGEEGNLEARTISTPTNVSFSFPSTSADPLLKGAVESSVQCLNLVKTDGGRGVEGIREIKLNAAAYFAAQNRMVTREDVVARIMSLPSIFGSPQKVFVKRDSVSPHSIDAYILAKDSDGHLSTASATLKRNIANYLKKYRMMTDGINLLDGEVINFRCKFGVMVAPKFNRSEVMVRCVKVISEYFALSKMQIGAPIVRSDVISALQDVEGVVSVYELTFTNVFGTVDGLEYWPTRFDFRASTKNGVIYCPEGTIFELKFPRRDIVGSTR
jgi:hypothetical protein